MLSSIVWVTKQIKTQRLLSSILWDTDADVADGWAVFTHGPDLKHRGRKVAVSPPPTDRAANMEPPYPQPATESSAGGPAHFPLPKSTPDDRGLDITRHPLAAAVSLILPVRRHSINATGDVGSSFPIAPEPPHHSLPISCLLAGGVVFRRAPKMETGWRCYGGCSCGFGPVTSISSSSIAHTPHVLGHNTALFSS